MKKENSTEMRSRFFLDSVMFDVHKLAKYILVKRTRLTAIYAENLGMLGITKTVNNKFHVKFFNPNPKDDSGS